MSTGWVRVDIPRGARAVGVWQVKAGGLTGQPGTAIAVPEGDCLVLLQFDSWISGARVAARLRSTVSVAPGRTTRLRIACAGGRESVQPSRPDAAFAGPLSLAPDSAGGATVTSATITGTPLYVAGVDRGDIIITLGGAPVRSDAEWQALLAAHAAGDEVPLVFRQRGREVRAAARGGPAGGGDADGVGRGGAHPIPAGLPSRVAGKPGGAVTPLSLYYYFFLAAIRARWRFSCARSAGVSAGPKSSASNT